MEKEIHEEIERYGDIIQANFSEKRLHLSLKAISAIHWIINFCPNVEYIIKSDDDVIVNIFKLLPYIKKKLSYGKKALLCKVNRNKAAHISRHQCPKWSVTFYSGKRLLCEYPNFCSGFLFVFPVTVLFDLYQMAFYEPIYHTDDVYITGALPLKLNITHIEARFVYYGHSRVSGEWIAACPMRINHIWENTASLLWIEMLTSSRELALKYTSRQTYESLFYNNTKEIIDMKNSIFK